MNINDLNIGMVFVKSGDPYKVLYREHSKMGRGGAVLRTKIKNLRTGAIQEETFKGGDKFEEANISLRKAQYLYKESGSFNFMDIESFEQFSISEEAAGEKGKFLIEGMEAELMLFDGKPLEIITPVKMNFRVAEAPPSIKGNTADGGSKTVTLENGLKITTPLFIKEGDLIRVNTETGEYVERA